MSGPVDVEPAPTTSPKCSTGMAPDSDVNALHSTPGNVVGLSATSATVVTKDYRTSYKPSVNYLHPSVEKDVNKANCCDDPDMLLRSFLRLASKGSDSLDPSSENTLMDRCLNAVLPICNGQVDQSLSTKIRVALERYTKAKEEADMCEPFVDASMAALESLRDLKVDGMRDPVTEVDITFQRNDGTTIAQNHSWATSCRKPDVVVILSRRRSDRSEKPTDDSTRASNRPNGTKEKKPVSGVCWQDVLSIVEFKRSGTMKRPPSKYSVSSPADVAGPTMELHGNVPPTGQSTLAKQMPSGNSSQAQECSSAKRQLESDTTRRSCKRIRRENPSGSTPLAETTQHNAWPPAKVETALYGAEMLSANAVVKYAVNFTVCDDNIWITIFDRQEVIDVRNFNFVQDLPRFMVLLYALQRFQLDSWGRVKELKASESGKEMEVILPDKKKNLIKLQLKNPARVPRIVLSGRGTELMDVVSSDLEEPDKCPATDGIAAKPYRGEERRHNEAAILDVVEQIAAVNDDVKGYVPMLRFPHKFDVSTSNIRNLEALGVKSEDAEKGGRTLHPLVFCKLQPIWTLLSNPKELLDVWSRCVLCHYGLWKGGVHHRDISVANLMYYRADGKAVGVVNDFDLATLAGSERKFDNKRTGTVPFMAINLLSKNGQNGYFAHEYRHEVESFIWVFTWVSCQYNHDGTLRKGFLDEWGKIDAIQCAEKKTCFLRSFPPDVDKHLQARARGFLDFLRDKYCLFDTTRRDLEVTRFSLDKLQNEEQAASVLKKIVAKLEAKLDGGIDDDMFRDFAEVIGFDDIEGKVERAAKGILTVHQVDFE